MKTKPTNSKAMKPDASVLTDIQVNRLSSLTGLSGDKLRKQSIAQLGENLKWQVNPELFWFRRICGRVVKKDPISGIDYPVPFATVYVEDTDCSFLGFFPPKSPWTWFWPLRCTREVIGETTTDACGHFCVWIPRFDIDWILRWRLERYCYSEIFIKPSIGDILVQIDPRIAVGPHGPGPDPGPEAVLMNKMALQRVEALLGNQNTRRLLSLQSAATLGGQASQITSLRDEPAFTSPFPPPATKLHQIYQREGTKGVAAHLNIAEEHVSTLKPEQYIGPFWRCYEFLVPEFVPILDVPDITFRVTQDVNGDGTPETIYSESHFDVRWNAGAIPDVTLQASAIARATYSCRTPDISCDEHGIQFIGLMPVHGGYLDPNGFATRPNKPRPGGLSTSPQATPATAPFTWTLQLYGCNHYPGASFYRVLYSFNGSAPVPFQGLTWPIYPWPAGTPAQTVVPDGDGWYPILPEGAFFPDHLLVEWPTGLSGTYNVSVEFADGAKHHIHTTPAIPIRVDNSDLFAGFTELRWRTVGGGWSAPMELICPVVHRPVVNGDPADIELSVSYAASTEHLRNVKVTPSGCGGANTPTQVSSDATVDHWHTGPDDNSVGNTAIFRISGNMEQGAYGFWIEIISRAFNPSGSDEGHILDWNYDSPAYRYRWVNLPVAVVNG